MPERFLRRLQYNAAKEAFFRMIKHYLCAAAALGILFAAVPAAAQTGTQNGEWRYYGGDDRSTRYSPLDQINETNVSQLQVAWRWKSTNFGPAPQPSSEVTPLMVNGVLYFTAGTTRTVVAADAATGETLWTYRLKEEGRGAVRANNRGVAYWTDGRGDDRVLAVSPGYQMIALNAKSGQPIAGFGAGGVVDLWVGLRRKPAPGTVGATSPPIIVRDVAIVGWAGGVGVALPKIENVPGAIRGYDVRSGKLLWTFNTVPQAGEFGVETWLEDSWKYTGNTGAWGPLTADDELGYVYIPVEMPSGDLYGGHRPGDNLFGDSLVCLDAKTGKRVWHYQLIHHDMWDWDIPAAPVLLDVTVNGRRIKAVAQVTKQAFTYVFNRQTGEPVWPIVERPVPQSDVPGERSAATQPFPTKPAAFDYQGYSEDILADFTPAIKAEALKSVQNLKLGPIFTPPIILDAGGKQGMLQIPGAGGGANWQGASGDPELGYLFVPSVTAPYISSLVNDPARSEMRYIAGGGLGGIPQPGGVPLLKPPYGRITAIDLNTGDHAWMIPNGQTPANVRNNAALKAAGVDTSNLGGGDRSPLLVTKTLLFAGGQKLRAIDKKTGRVIHEMELTGAVGGGPMTYSVNGRQFVVMAIGGREGHELIGLALPQPGGGRGGRGGAGRGGPPQN
jgi:quinoprotein glucose dehydrogenase